MYRTYLSSLGLLPWKRGAGPVPTPRSSSSEACFSRDLSFSSKKPLAADNLLPQQLGSAMKGCQQSNYAKFISTAILYLPLSNPLFISFATSTFMHYSTGLQLAFNWPSTGFQLAFNWLSTGFQLAFNWPPPTHRSPISAILIR
jgi:hypothetical protein